MTHPICGYSEGMAGGGSAGPGERRDAEGYCGMMGVCTTPVPCCSFRIEKGKGKDW